jgi:hypothetical protein
MVIPVNALVYYCKYCINTLCLYDILLQSLICSHKLIRLAYQCMISLLPSGIRAGGSETTVVWQVRECGQSDTCTHAQVVKESLSA